MMKEKNIILATTVTIAALTLLIAPSLVTALITIPSPSQTAVGPIDDMDPAGWVYVVEFQCGYVHDWFNHYLDTGFDVMEWVPVAKGFYRTNVLLHNDDPQFPTDDIYVKVLFEYVDSVDEGSPISPEINSAWLEANPGDGALEPAVINLEPDEGLGITCEDIWDTYFEANIVSLDAPQQVFPDFLKGILVISQVKGDGELDTSAEPISVRVTHTYMLTEEKITFMVLKDLAEVGDRVPEQYWRKPLDLIVPIPPTPIFTDEAYPDGAPAVPADFPAGASENTVADGWANFIEPDMIVLNSLLDQWPNAQPIIKILDTDVSTGSSIHTREVTAKPMPEVPAPPLV